MPDNPGRPLSPEGADEEARAEQLAFAFEYAMHLTVVRGVRNESKELLRHDQQERRDLLALGTALDSEDVSGARAIWQRLWAANRAEDRRHVDIARLVMREEAS